MSIKSIMRSKGITVNDLAEKLCISRQAASVQINGTVLKKSAEAIADVLGVPYWQLLACPDELLECLVKSSDGFVALVKNGDDYYCATSLAELKDIAHSLKRNAIFVDYVRKRNRDYGLHIKDVLAYYGVTIKECAEKIGITRGYLSKIANGGSDFKMSLVLKIANVIGCPVEELLVGYEYVPTFLALIKNGGNYYTLSSIGELSDILGRL